MRPLLALCLLACSSAPEPVPLLVAGGGAPGTGSGGETASSSASAGGAGGAPELGGMGGMGGAAEAGAGGELGGSGGAPGAGGMGGVPEPVVIRCLIETSTSGTPADVGTVRICDGATAYQTTILYAGASCSSDGTAPMTPCPAGTACVASWFPGHSGTGHCVP